MLWLLLFLFFFAWSLRTAAMSLASITKGSESENIAVFGKCGQFILCVTWAFMSFHIYNDFSLANHKSQHTTASCEQKTHFSEADATKIRADDGNSFHDLCSFVKFRLMINSARIPEGKKKPVQQRENGYSTSAEMIDWWRCRSIISLTAHQTIRLFIIKSFQWNC